MNETHYTLTYEEELATTWWMDDAACIELDTEIFFPGRGESTNPAKRICDTCPVTDFCLAYALVTGQKHGIWGGLSERERRVMRGYYRRAVIRATAAKLHHLEVVS